MELWNNTTTLEKAATFTPYVFIVLGALSNPGLIHWSKLSQEE